MFGMDHAFQFCSGRKELNCESFTLHWNSKSPLVRNHKPKSACQDGSTVYSKQSRRVLILFYVVFQFFSRTEVKITCQQVLFSNLETVLFRHVACYFSVPFSSQSLVPSPLAWSEDRTSYRGLQTYEQEDSSSSNAM